MRRVLASLAAVCGLSVALHATTVIEPTFEQLVANADAIFEGVVVNTQSTLRTNASGRVIVTTVSFEVRNALKGSLPSVITLEFLGGTVGELTMEVADMPQFAAGDEDVLFVRQGPGASPVVAFMHGRFRIARTSSGSQIRRYDGRAFGSVTTLGRPATGTTLASQVPLALGDFETAIAREVARQGAAR